MISTKREGAKLSDFKRFFKYDQFKGLTSLARHNPKRTGSPYSMKRIRMNSLR